MANSKKSIPDGGESKRSSHALRAQPLSLEKGGDEHGHPLFSRLVSIPDQRSQDLQERAVSSLACRIPRDLWSHDQPAFRREDRRALRAFPPTPQQIQS